jgi:cytochrome c biogenesis protein CcdA
MATGYVTAALSAVGLGLLTSVHPCPLASNSAAVSFLCGSARGPRGALASGLMYAAGRVAAYVGLGIGVAYAALSVPDVAEVTRLYAARLLGPFLVLAGMVVSGLIPLPTPGPKGRFETLRTWAAGWRWWGAFLFGAVLAVSFCPASAALFFGALVPLAIERGSPFLVPALYGAGTALPLVAVSVSAAKGAAFVERRLRDGGAFGAWLSRIAGAVVILVGVYFTLDRVYRVF